MSEYRQRIVDDILLDKLEAKGAVLIEGPKWCGKTTTALQVAKSVIRMDDPTKRDENIVMSELNHVMILRGDTPRLIDEWQIAPKIWDAVRYEVDSRGEEGQFILTGSAVPVESNTRAPELVPSYLSTYKPAKSVIATGLSRLYNSINLSLIVKFVALIVVVEP